jgi:hypothetical protein
MTDLIPVPQLAEWQRLKTLVPDSVSSPITRRVYNTALDEFIPWYGLEPPPGLQQGDGERLAGSLEAHGLGSSSIIIPMSAIRKLAAEAADNGLLAPELAAGCLGQEREVHWRLRWQLAGGKAGASFAQRARRHHGKGAARSRHPRRPPGPRAAPVGGRRANR